MAECRLSKPDVVGSTPITRSSSCLSRTRAIIVCPQTGHPKVGREWRANVCRKKISPQNVRITFRAASDLRLFHAAHHSLYVQRRPCGRHVNGKRINERAAVGLARDRTLRTMALSDTNY